MYNATETQKEVVKYLNELVNTFSGVAVPLHLAKFIKEAGAAIGLCVCSSFLNVENYTIVLYLA